MSNAARSARLPGLDGLRAISIGLVLLDHLEHTKNFPAILSDQRPYVGDLGGLGVRVFFVISGFLITHLLLGELERHGRISLRDFYLRRAIRILPALAVFLLGLATAQSLGWVNPSRWDWIHALTFSMNYSPNPKFSIGHLWSLSVEEQFYILWPIAMAFYGRRMGFGIVSAVVALLPIVRVVVFRSFPEYRPYMDESFETVADSLATGCLLAMTRDRLAQTSIYRMIMDSRLFVILAVIVTVAANRLDPHPMAFMLVCQTVMNLLIAAVIEWSVHNARPGRPGHFLESRALTFVGVRSYSLYLWQEPFLNHHLSAVVTAFPLNLVVSFAAAFASYAFVELPALRLRRHFTR